MALCAIVIASEAKQSSRAPSAQNKKSDIRRERCIFFLARFARAGLLRFARNDGAGR
jgi:hypothetical protein